MEVWTQDSSYSIDSILTDLINNFHLSGMRTPQRRAFYRKPAWTDPFRDGNKIDPYDAMRHLQGRNSWSEVWLKTPKIIFGKREVKGATR